MAFVKDYKSKLIKITKLQHMVYDFPIIQIYVIKSANKFELANPQIHEITVDKDLNITIRFAIITSVRIVIK